MARLKAKLPDFAVEFFPDNPEEYRLNHPKGALLVQYLRSRYAEQDDCDAVVQERKAEVAIVVMVRQLRGRDGAVATIDRVEAAMMGYRVSGWRPFRLVENRFIREKAGLWSYVVVVGSECQRVEDRDNESSPGLSHVVFEGLGEFDLNLEDHP